MIDIVRGSFQNGIITIHPADESYTQSSLQSPGELSLSFSLAEFVEFPVGCYCMLNGIRYTLTQPENITMNHSRNYQYTLLMYDPGYLLKDFKFRNTVDGRLAFSMTARAHELLREVVNNLNERTDINGSPNRIKWITGECIESVEHTVSFSYNNISEVLQMAADEFKTEWEIVPQPDCITYSVNLRKVEYSKDDTVPLSYGQGNGFKSGVKRSNDGSAREIYRMYVQGGDRNLPVTRYGYSHLMLPPGEPEMEYPSATDSSGVASGRRRYRVSRDRSYIYNKDKGDNGYEDTVNCEHIYPSYVGHVTGVIVKDGYYDIVDAGIARDTKFETAENDKMRIVFQSGMLAGKEFDVSEFVSYYDDGGVYQGGRFLLCNQSLDGVDMPSGIFAPTTGNKYVVFGCNLPDSYITDAQNKMFEEAARMMYENEYPKFSFTGELDSIYLRSQGELFIDRYIKTGGYIRFNAPFVTTDNGELIRITGVKRNLNNRYKIDLTLSNGSPNVSFSNTINEIKAQEVVVSDNRKEAISYAKRRYSDAIEAQNMLKNAMLKEFTESVSPITVQTMQMIVGSPQMQFDFIEPDTNRIIAFPGRWNRLKKQFIVDGGLIRHYTFGKEKIMSSENDNTVFDIASSMMEQLDDACAGKAYYLYIVHPQTAVDFTGMRSASYELSEKAHEYMEKGNYYFLVGILNSENEGDRSFTQLYGYTEITPGRIVTDAIVSKDGLSVFNLLENKMQLSSEKTSNRLTWQNGELEVSGKLRQVSGDGKYYEVGVYRGDYNDGATYYRGDDVNYEAALEVCTYRCIAESTKGNNPLDTNYWKVVSRGKAGERGAPIVFRGDWKPESEYYGTMNRLDVVKHNNSYYVAKNISGTIQAGSPAPDAETGDEKDKKWTSFGGQFDSVATGLLLSEKAVIDNLVVRELRTTNQGRRVEVNTADNNSIIMYDENNQLKLKMSGDQLSSDHVSRSFPIDPYYKVYDPVIIPKHTIPLCEMSCEAANNMVAVPGINMIVSFEIDPYSLYDRAQLNVLLRLASEDGITAYYLDSKSFEPSFSFPFNPSVPSITDFTFTTEGRVFSLPVGMYSLELVIVITADVVDPSGYITFEAKANDTLDVKYVKNLTEFASDGFRVVLDNNHFMEFRKVSGGSEIMLYNDDCGLKIDSDGIYIKRKPGSGEFTSWVLL